MSTPIETIQKLLATVMEDGLEEGFRLFTGLYRGRVKDNRDPEERGRIKVVMEDFGHDTALNQWVTPVFVLAGDKRGAFYPPEIGDKVRVVFFAGDQARPLAYFPGWYIDDALPSEFSHSDEHLPHVRGFVSRGGHSILFSDEPDEQFVQLLWHQPEDGDEMFDDPSKSADRTAGVGKTSWLRFTKDGGFQLLANGGECVMSYETDSKQFIVLDSHGNQIVMDDQGLKLQDKEQNYLGLADGDVNIICKNAVNITAKEINFGSGGVALGSPAVNHSVLGELLLAYLTSHTHVATGPTAPTSPPVVPPPPSLLSKSIKVKV